MCAREPGMVAADLDVNFVSSPSAFPLPGPAAGSTQPAVDGFLAGGLFLSDTCVHVLQRSLAPMLISSPVSWRRNRFQCWRRSTVKESLPRMCEVLGLIDTQNWRRGRDDQRTMNLNGQQPKACGRMARGRAWLANFTVSRISPEP